LIVWVHWWPPLDAIQSYILRIYLGPTPFQSLSLLTTVNWGATTSFAFSLNSQRANYPFQAKPKAFIRVFRLIRASGRRL
jgi:hypothetical protein